MRYGGRQKGTPNKKTVALTDLLEKISCDPAAKLASLLPKLKPDMQAKVLLELMEYIYPKRKAVEVSGVDGEAIEINQHSDFDKEQVAQLKAELMQVISRK